MNKVEQTFVAHRLRDGRSFYPENSMEAYIDALNNPEVGGLELDIQRTKDGEFVLMNYKTIENVTSLADPNRNKISDYTYDELLQMEFHANLAEIEKAILTDAVEFGEQAQEILEYYKKLKEYCKTVTIPKLDDILSVPRNGKKLFIEIKTDYSKEQKQESISYARDLTTILEKYNLNGVAIIGRDTNTLEAIKQEKPFLPCMPVVGYDDAEKLTYGFDGASIAENHLQKIVPGVNKLAWEYMIENGQEVAVWNLRTYEALLRTDKVFADTGIDYNPTSDFAGVNGELYRRKK